jgi:hypothetical protein
MGDGTRGYRPSARRGNDAYNAMNHIGFRLVSDGAAPGKRLSASNSPVSSE